MSSNSLVVIAGCLIEKDSKFLLVQEKKPKAYGLWNLPAGHVDKGENIEQAAVREAKEETGLDVQILYKIGVYGNPKKTHSINIYKAAITNGNIDFPKDEILDINWFTHDDIVNLKHSDKLRGDFVQKSIEDDIKKSSH